MHDLIDAYHDDVRRAVGEFGAAATEVAAAFKTALDCAMVDCQLTLVEAIVRFESATAARMAILRGESAPAEKTEPSESADKAPPTSPPEPEDEPTEIDRLLNHGAQTDI